MVIMMVVLTIAVAISAQLVYRYFARKQIEFQIPAVASYAGPGHLFVHRGHTWARLETSGEAKIGIDHFLIKILGGADKVSFPQPGREVRQGEKVLCVARGGREVELVAPIAGVVTAVNEDVNLNAEAVKKDPYRNSWIFSIKPQNLTDGLRNVKGIEESSSWFETEVKRFSTLLVADMGRFAEVGATMQDGGQYPSGIIERMNNEQFQTFKRQFLA